VGRRADAVGVLALDGLDSVHLATPFLESAFALLRGVRAVVLDLGRNGGGDPGSLTLVRDWLLGAEPTHISDVVYRDRTRQWWTTGRAADRALGSEAPVAVLVGAGTFSSGEALAYHIQSQGRGRVVGQRTRVPPTTSRRSGSTRTSARSSRRPGYAMPSPGATGKERESFPTRACPPEQALETVLELHRAR
jgi:hypothetical protein